MHDVLEQETLETGQIDETATHLEEAGVLIRWHQTTSASTLISEQLSTMTGRMMRKWNRRPTSRGSGETSMRPSAVMSTILPMVLPLSVSQALTRWGVFLRGRRRCSGIRNPFLDHNSPGRGSPSRVGSFVFYPYMMDFGCIGIFLRGITFGEWRPRSRPVCAACDPDTGPSNPRPHPGGRPGKRSGKDRHRRL